MQTRLITSEKEFAGLRDAWNGLLHQSSNDAVHLRHEWMTTWWECFGKGSSLNIIVVYDDAGSIAGIAPLTSRKEKYRGIPIQKISLMINGHSPAGDIISRAGCIDRVVESLFERLGRDQNWDLLSLDKLNSEGPTFGAVKAALGGEDLRLGVRANLDTPYVAIDSSWDDFMKERAKRFKKSMRNKINRALKSGEITIEEVPLESSANPVFSEILSISGESWKRELKTDLCSNRSYYYFYKGLTDRLGKLGLTRVWLLKQNGKPIAFEYHILYNGVVYPIRADYSQRYSEISPGSVLEYKILKTFFQNSSAKEYNTCGHSYKYLMNWTDKVRKYRDMEIFRMNARGSLIYSIEYNVIPILRKFKPGRNGGFHRRPEKVV